MTTFDEEQSQIAFCECGAQLVGNSRSELFEAAQSHLAHHHPQLLGAVGLDLVSEMAQVRPGAVNV
jgi:hypothetical protein